MTTRTAPVLDRFITTAMIVTIPGTAEELGRFTYPHNIDGNSYGDGSWRIQGQVLKLGLEDVNGDAIPTDLSPNAVEIAGVVYDIDSFVYKNPFQGSRFDITLQGNVTAIQDLTDLGEIVFRGGASPDQQETTTFRHWAARRELRVSDQVDLTSVGLLGISDVYFVVRTLPDESWALQGALTDDRGLHRTIQGINYEEYGRGRYTTLLARAVTS